MKSEKGSTDMRRLNKEMAMKKPSILCLMTLLAIAPVCFSQVKPTKAGKITLVVSDNAKRIAGVVHLHDLLKHGIF